MFEIFIFIVGVCLLSDHNQIIYMLLHYNINDSFDNILLLFYIFEFNDALCLLCTFNVHSLKSLVRIPKREGCVDSRRSGGWVQGGESVVKPFWARRRGSLLSEVKGKCRDNMRAIGARSVCLFEQDGALCFYCSYNLAALHTAVL